jgi:hypothetical protein
MIFSRSLFGMPESATPMEVFDLILAGSREWEIAPLLRQLTDEDRQNLLCTVCAMRGEIARNCCSTAAEVNALLTTKCSLFIHGAPTCGFERLAS